MISVRFTWKRTKPYLLIIGICMVLAMALNVVHEQRRDQAPKTELDKAMTEKVKEILGVKGDAETLEKLKGAYQGKASKAEMERLKEQFKDRLDPAEMEKLRKAYQEMR